MFRFGLLRKQSVDQLVSKLTNSSKFIGTKSDGTQVSRNRHGQPAESKLLPLDSGRSQKLPVRSLYISARDDESQRTADISFDALGAWDNRIDLPLQMDSSIKHGEPIPKVTSSQVGCSSLQGKRTYQEDRFFVKDLQDDLLCAAVFDGHGGAQCSQYCFENIEKVLETELAQNTDLELVLHHAFLKLHQGYVDWCGNHGEGNTAGTTATVCLLRKGVQLAVGHVGDSRAMLCRGGGPKVLTQDHCPSVATEKVRIEASGGNVALDNIGRHMVNGALSMSRSIGDLHLKQAGVIALPDTRTLKVKHGKDAFLLLTTDGIHFPLADREVCSLVCQAEDPVQAAEQLTEQALTMASEDNLTALVVPFGSWGKYSTSASMFYSFGIGRDIVKSSRFG
ncbi:protein phosphatase Mn(2+)-dependent 1K-like [Oratosquilla oratoria]|uniref:protein phosphatase Mn(2+)-dependent 1K-like n=1 Tax=Oratosquilla oratoria TaxID=337810 RepID=UPI003F7588AF